jgi:putative nucleotidyltransferase with HDIG domain
VPLKFAFARADTSWAVARRALPDVVSRSVTLLRAFLVLSALILASGAVVLGTVLAGALRDQAVDDAERSLSEHTEAFVGPHLVQGDKVVVDEEAAAVLEHDLERRANVVNVKVWRADGTLIWTHLEPERIGRQYPLGGGLLSAIETGRADGHLEDLHEEEDAAEALGISKLLEVYAPIEADGEVVGAYEIYADAAPLEASIADRRRLIWATTACVFALLWLGLALFVRTASRTLSRQTEVLRQRSRALADSYQRLEDNALEAVETLNATVEAKDPYTAGHSRRVQRIAVAVGEELGFTPKQLEALRFGGMFHDIGKLAIPDSILTKPATLTPEEYERIKLHSAEGARIVARLGRLREAVPIIHHHHERWDGRGYPDGLAGTEIPLAAAVVGLADAWDAMTTERPYHRALELDEAFAEVRNGRGTQFVPQVVDAFFSVVRKRPGELGDRDGEAGAEARAAG